jgi:hypothetical protein
MNSYHGTTMALKSSKTKTKPVELQKKTNKDIVLEKHPEAEIITSESGFFYVGVKSGKNINPIHSGFAKNESDAWKRAAHEVM